MNNPAYRHRVASSIARMARWTVGESVGQMSMIRIKSGSIPRLLGRKGDRASLWLSAARSLRAASARLLGFAVAGGGP
jgi:hypothetical protein